MTPRQPKVLVAQLGARRHYLVPIAVNSDGLLDTFYTDIYLNGPISRNVVQFGSSLLRGRGLRRLQARTDPGLPNNRVRSFPAFGLAYKTVASIAKTRGELSRAWIWGGRTFARRIARKGLGQANAVYAFSSAALEVFQAAKQAGALCILDHATAPKRFEDRLTALQAERYPHWASHPPQLDRWCEEYSDRQRQEAELADVIVCGSKFIQHAIEQEFGQGHKCQIVPLGLRQSAEYLPVKPADQKRRLRLLFVGDEAIRKGVADFCEAVQRIGLSRCEARVVGNVDLSDYGRKRVAECATLMGPVPRQEMHGLYEWADLCVLPSVSDTFGLVVLEAMSHGVPVITTPHTGASDAIEDGVNGYIVPIMAPDAIAECISHIGADRTHLQRLSDRCRRDFSRYTASSYSENLAAVIKQAFAVHYQIDPSERETASNPLDSEAAACS